MGIEPKAFRHTSLLIIPGTWPFQDPQVVLRFNKTQLFPHFLLFVVSLSFGNFITPPLQTFCVCSPHEVSFVCCYHHPPKKPPTSFCRSTYFPNNATTQTFLFFKLFGPEKGFTATVTNFPFPRPFPDLGSPSSYFSSPTVCAVGKRVPLFFYFFPFKILLSFSFFYLLLCTKVTTYPPVFRPPQILCCSNCAHTSLFTPPVCQFIHPSSFQHSPSVPLKCLLIPKSFPFFFFRSQFSPALPGF